MYEYLLKFWGQATPRVRQEIGTDETNFWFSTKEDRDKFKAKIRKYAGDHTVVFSEEEGEDVRKRTVVVLTAEYKEKEYPDVEYDYGYGYPEETAEFMFFDGNYSCDCNLSRIIKSTYPDFPELEECGDEIEYKAFRIDKR